jgi:anti-sigma regulatory factor (Ser/Thr protein kinase)
LPESCFAGNVAATATVPALRGEIEALVRGALLPQRFPERRDVELSFAVSPAGERACLFDYVWLDERLLAAAAIGLDRHGLNGALELAALRQLLRALLSRLDDPQLVLEQLHELSGRAEMDVAIVRVDTVAAALSWAQAGNGAVVVGDAQCQAQHEQITAGAMVWLSVGGKLDGLPAAVPVEGLQALVEPALQRLGDGAVGAVLFKAPAQAADSATFVIANDRNEIPAFLRAARRFFARHGLVEDDVAGLEVALDEILTNQVNYGYRDGLRHEVLVSMTAEPGRLELEIRDDGAPFDPLSVPEPDLSADLDERQIGGLGMHFVRSLLDKVSYHRSNGWNILALAKTLKPGQSSGGS